MVNDNNKECAVSDIVTDSVSSQFASAIGKDNGVVDFGILDGKTFPTKLYSNQLTTSQDCYSSDAFFYVQFTCI